MLYWKLQFTTPAVWKQEWKQNRLVLVGTHDICHFFTFWTQNVIYMVTDLNSVFRISHFGGVGRFDRRDQNPTGQCIPEQVTFIQFTCRFQNVKTTDNYKWHTNSKQQLKLQHCYSQSIKIGQSSKTKSDDVKTYNWSHSDLSRVACWSLHKHVLWTANLDVFLFHFVFFWATLKSILFSCVWKLGQWATTFWVHWPSGQNLLFEPLLNQHNQMDIRGGSWH